MQTPLKLCLRITAIVLFACCCSAAFAQATQQTLISDKVDGVRFRAELIVPEKFLTFHPFDSHFLVKEILTNKRALRVMPVHNQGYGYIEIEFIYLDRFGNTDEQQIKNYLLAQAEIGNEIIEDLNKDDVYPIQIQEFTLADRVENKQQRRTYQATINTKKAFHLGDGILWRPLETKCTFIQLTNYLYLSYCEHGKAQLAASVAEQMSNIYNDLRIFEH